MTEVANLDGLRAALAAAHEQGGRDGASAALYAVNKFLVGLGLSYAEVRPLFNIMAGLEDHSRGKPHPLLAVAKRGGNRAHMADDQFKAAVAATMTMPQRAGREKRVAARTISERLLSHQIRVSPNTIDGWHREISSERHPEVGVIDSYKLYLSKCGEDAALSAEAALMTLPSLARTQL